MCKCWQWVRSAELREAGAVPPSTSAYLIPDTPDAQRGWGWGWDQVKTTQQVNE